jgi:hypothetical protein
VHVEQKNWARVREVVGYYRYDTPAELDKLNEIWALDAQFTNYFLPQQKLVLNQRHRATTRPPLPTSGRSPTGTWANATSSR